MRNRSSFSWMLTISLELFVITVIILTVSSKFTSFCILHRFLLNELANDVKTTPSLIIKPIPRNKCLTSLGCSIIFSRLKISQVFALTFLTYFFISTGIIHLIVLYCLFFGY